MRIQLSSTATLVANGNARRVVFTDGSTRVLSEDEYRAIMREYARR